MPDLPKMDCWAIVQLYNAFVMGGKVWSWHRYLVPQAELIDIEGVSLFIFQCPVTRYWQVNERSTGGFIAEGSDRDWTVGRAATLINTTPDLQAQIKQLGPVMGRPETDFKKARETLAKQQKMNPREVSTPVHLREKSEQ